MKLILRAFAASVLAIVIAIAIMIWRTTSYGADATSTDAIALPDPPAFNLDAAAQSLGAAIRFQTVTYESGDPKPGNDQPWLDLRAHLDATYPELLTTATVETVANYSILITWAGSAPELDPLILMAHQDVVPINPGTDADWTHGPFGGVVADARIWGRGSLDDKGSVIGILEAANALAKSGWTPKRTTILMFGHDEEVAGQGAQAMFALLKSRNVTPAMVLDEGFFVMENNPITGKPTAMIGVAEKGSVSVSITANTEGGHSSRPPLNSGAVRIARAILALEENQMPIDLKAPPFADTMKALAPDLSFMTRLALANQWALGGAVKSQLSEGVAAAMVRTTTAPTMMTGSIKENVLPQRANAVVNFRIHPNDSVDSVVQHVHDVTSHIPDLTIEKTGGLGGGMNASPVSKTSGPAWEILHAMATEAANGAPAAPTLVIAATDARFATAISDDDIYRFVPSILSDDDLAFDRNMDLLPVGHQCGKIQLMEIGLTGRATSRIDGVDDPSRRIQGVDTR